MFNCHIIFGVNKSQTQQRAHKFKINNRLFPFQNFSTCSKVIFKKTL
jgi:hypothetical protein